PGVNDYAYQSALVGALTDAVNDGMDVVTLSLSEGDLATYAPLDVDSVNCADSNGDTHCDVRVEAVENAVKLGMVVVTSAGNDGNTAPNYPTLNSIHTPGTARPRTRLAPIGERPAGMLGFAGGVACGGHRVGPARHLPVQQQGDQCAECGRGWRYHLPTKRLGYAAQRVGAGRRHSGRHDRQPGWRGAEELSGCEPGRNRDFRPEPHAGERRDQHGVAQF